MSDYLDKIRSLSPLEQVVHWITERERVRIEKTRTHGFGQSERVPPPWTEDPIIQNWRFCNVRRMDDKVSKWLDRNWYTPNIDHPNMLPAIALARFINQPATLKEIGFPLRWRPSHIKRKVRAVQLHLSGPTYNAAYMVRGNDGEDKIDSIVDHYCAPLRKLKVPTDTMRGAWEVIVQSYGMGSFMAGQIVADLRWAVEGKWSDRKTWAPIGPGSKAGLEYVVNAPSVAITPKNWDFYFEWYRWQMKERLPKALFRRLEGIDLQNTLCEGGKYIRTLQGGRPKQRYP